MHVVVWFYLGANKTFLYGFHKFSTQKPNDHPTLGFPFVLEVPKTTHIFSDSPERLTELDIYLYSQLRTVTVKGCTTGSARKKDTGRIGKNPFIGFRCPLPSMSRQTKCASFSTSKKCYTQYFCPEKLLRDSAPGCLLGLVPQTPFAWLPKFQASRIKQVFTISYGVCTV